MYQVYVRNNLFELSCREVVVKTKCLNELNVANRATAKLIHTLHLSVLLVVHGGESFLKVALNVFSGLLVAYAAT
jgi:hypothetical protein